MTRSATLLPASPQPRTSRRAWLLAVAVAMVIGGGFALDRLRAPGTPTLDPAAIHPGFGQATFAEATAKARDDVIHARADLARTPGEWTRGERLASALVSRWQLEGDYADLAEAARLLDEAIAAVPDPGGPALLQAQLEVTVHRLDRADAALDRVGRWVVPYPAEVADAAALRGDVALQRGLLDRATGEFARAGRTAPSTGIGLRKAMLSAWMGDRDMAARSLEAMLAEPRQPPMGLAQMMLQRANLAYMSGEWDEAGRWTGAAQRMLPGYWLADAYAAQQFALAGRTDDAIRAYEIVARRTGRPEVQDALAHLLRLQGRGAESRAWAAKAAAGWEARARLLPEAVIHHRAEHELAVGSATKALAFARADAIARPQAPNLVLLARALLVAGKPREALAALDRADAQGWVSAGQQMARAETLAALGDTAGSEAARAKAEAINPRAADPRTRLIWFGHD